MEYMQVGQLARHDGELFGVIMISHLSKSYWASRTICIVSVLSLSQGMGGVK